MRVEPGVPNTGGPAAALFLPDVETPEERAGPGPGPRPGPARNSQVPKGERKAGTSPIRAGPRPRPGR